MKNKLFSLLLAFVACFILTACDEEEGQSSNGNKVSNKTEEKIEVPDDLNFIYGYGEGKHDESDFHRKLRKYSSGDRAKIVRFRLTEPGETIEESKYDNTRLAKNGGENIWAEYNYKDDTLNIVSTDIIYLDEDCTNMFTEFKEIEEIIFENVDTTYVKSMYKMFYDCNDLKKVIFKNCKFNNLEDISFMFYDCLSLEEVDISNSTNYSKEIKYAMGTFKNCTNLEKVDMTGLDLNGVEFGDQFSLNTNKSAYTGINSKLLRDKDIDLVRATRKDGVISVPYSEKDLVGLDIDKDFLIEYLESSGFTNVITEDLDENFNSSIKHIDYSEGGFFGEIGSLERNKEIGEDFEIKISLGNPLYLTNDTCPELNTLFTEEGINYLDFSEKYDGLNFRIKGYLYENDDNIPWTRNQHSISVTLQNKLGQELEKKDYFFLGVLYEDTVNGEEYHTDVFLELGTPVIFEGIIDHSETKFYDCIAPKTTALKERNC